MHETHRATVSRFVTACQADDRIVAAFLGGSHARGDADEYSDLDLYVITADEAYDDFYTGRAASLALLGEPLSAEDFDIPDMIFFVLADGTEGELGIGRESNLSRVHEGAYRVLVDKRGLLSGVEFPRRAAVPGKQVETARRLIYWFWHDLSHFTTAMARGHLLWAAGQLDTLRHYCVRLARLRHDFGDPDAAGEGYFKVEKAIPVEKLVPLEPTFYPLDREAMLEAAALIVAFYQEVAAGLATQHGLPYPERLERLALERLQLVSRAQRG